MGETVGNKCYVHSLEIPLVVLELLEVEGTRPALARMAHDFFRTLALVLVLAVTPGFVAGGAGAAPGLGPLSSSVAGAGASVIGGGDGPSLLL